MKLYTLGKCPHCKGKGKVKTVVPEALREIRAKAGLTLAQLGKKIGFSSMYLSDIETGRRNPTAQIVLLYKKL